MTGVMVGATTVVVPLPYLEYSAQGETEVVFSIRFPLPNDRSLT
jgi:hypothetical protein